MSGKNFETSKYDVSGKFFLLCPEKFVETPPRPQLFREKIFRCPFLFGKCPSKPGPPQLLEASYAPAPMPNIAYTKKTIKNCF
jgi:hypothetical protein